jgi:hypothetical protein
MRSLAFLFILALSALVGCSAGSATKLPEAGPVSGTLARADGSPVGSVLLMLQPTTTGHMTSFEVDAEGKFSGEAVAGPYAWFVAKSAKADDADKALTKVPEAFQQGSLERKVTVGGSAPIAIVIP